MTSVLVVEDESHLAEGLRFNLEAEGYQVDVIGDGDTALERLLTEREHFSAVVLDVMLPGLDGFEVATQLRHKGQFVPILMLTARGRAEDVLKGFEAGADDYLAKPFELAILVARLNGLIRRSRWPQRNSIINTGVETVNESSGVAGSLTTSGVQEYAKDVFVFDGKTIDFGALELVTPDRTIRLTLMETELLRYLIARSGLVVSRKSILEEVWNLRVDTDTRAIDNFIVRLRRYIEDDPAKPRLLLTVRGVGYRFVPNP
jgi:two-component system alkaline phosphatase synthesis response regulator PhoP